jgi:TRAP-type C4-dicarboxylate transport system permease small subunit
MSAPDERAIDHGARPLSRAVHYLAALCALAGGAILTGIACMSVASIVPRALGFDPIQGDYELVQVGLAVCIALFLPWCQLRGGNIVVDFFTTRLRMSVQRKLDAAGAAVFAVVMGVLAWRTAVGALALKAAGETTMILGFPIWIGYAAMTPGLALTAVTGVYAVLAAWAGSRAAADRTDKPACRG